MPSELFDYLCGIKMLIFSQFSVLTVLRLYGDELNMFLVSFKLYFYCLYFCICMYLFEK